MKKKISLAAACFFLYHFLLFFSRVPCAAPRSSSRSLHLQVSTLFSLAPSQEDTEKDQASYAKAREKHELLTSATRAAVVVAVVVVVVVVRFRPLLSSSYSLSLSLSHHAPQAPQGHAQGPALLQDQSRVQGALQGALVAADVLEATLHSFGRDHWNFEKKPFPPRSLSLTSLLSLISLS